MNDLEIADDSAQHQNALVILDELHRAGFSRCWMESVKMFSGGLAERKDGVTPPQVQHHALRVILEDEELNADALATVLTIAENNAGRLSLARLRLNGQEFSRLAIWPSNKVAAMRGT